MLLQTLLPLPLVGRLRLPLSRLWRVLQGANASTQRARLLPLASHAVGFRRGAAQLECRLGAPGKSSESVSFFTNYYTV